jgi:hypothetical protein
LIEAELIPVVVATFVEVWLKPAQPVETIKNAVMLTANTRLISNVPLNKVNYNSQ